MLMSKSFVQGFLKTRSDKLIIHAAAVLQYFQIHKHV